jgi:hypothetical protein
VSSAEYLWLLWTYRLLTSGNRQAAETEGRMRMKKAQSQKKQGRRTKGADD